MTHTGVPEAGLTGVRVIDLTRLLPGNYATLLLAEMGADVIKVEPLDGDGTRAVAPRTSTGESAAHVVLNRRKRSIALNLKSDKGREVFLDLVATADVCLDSFRPQVMDRLGLGDAQLWERNPSLVSVSITAYGPEGDRRLLPGHDLNAESLSGLLSLTGDDEGRPVMPAVPSADLAAGMQAALAVFNGLRVAEQTGRGTHANVSMADSALSLTSLPAASVVAESDAPPPPRDLLTGELACYNLYECADGRWIAVGAIEPKFFQRLCVLIDQPDLVELQYDLHRQADLRAALAAVFMQRTQSAWVALLAEDQTCVTPVYDMFEALADLQRRGAHTTVRLADGTVRPVAAAAPWMPTQEGVSAPGLSADADQILSSLGYDDDARVELYSAQIVGPSS